jgi:hypothetical protein
MSLASRRQFIISPCTFKLFRFPDLKAGGIDERRQNGHAELLGGPAYQVTPVPIGFWCIPLEKCDLPV